ncbi:MAG TPA: MMPL family transporter, partial [Kofleriaceae bacterium]|nr:MMPL family transporter [Kofleriaceae bacterium]
LDANRVGVVVLSLAIIVLGGYLASRMSLKSSLTALLPSSTRSVKDLHDIEDRARRFGTVHVLMVAPDPATRERAGTLLATAMQDELPKDLVAQLIIDDGPQQRYTWDHRFLFADVKDLVAARDALAERIDHAKLQANPLFIQLDDESADASHDKLTDLEKQLDDLEAKAKHPTLRISKDGTMQLVTIQTTFGPSNVREAHRLLRAVRHATDRVRGDVGPAVTFGVTGNITTALYEHDSVLDGMATSGIVAVLLCALGLMLYYRAGRIVLAILWALATGVAATFAMAWATVGSLNVMTAFLFAIVVGNGINPGMVLAARYLDELRRDDGKTRSTQMTRDALTRAISGSLAGTFAAMATSSVAYLSLLVTDFKGFRQFGAIAGFGMVLTWVTTFTVLPAVLYMMSRWGWIRSKKPTKAGEILARTYSERHRLRVLALGALLTAIALVIAVRYVMNDPFTRDWRDLQSSNAAIEGTRRLDGIIRENFDTKAFYSGQAYQVAIAVSHREDVEPLVKQIRLSDEMRPPNMRWLRDAKSIDDLLPADQAQKLAVLADIRKRIDDPALQATLSDEDQARLAKVRPPDDLVKLGDNDVPAELGWPFIERDGTRGRLIILRGAVRFDSFNVQDRLSFATEVRGLDLPKGALVAGEALVIADIIESMETDAPKIIGFALLGSILTVVVVLGFRRHGMVTLACGMAGVIVMIAACAIANLTVHFLDLIALPITIGIGIEYAVNLAAREREEGHLGGKHLMATTGSAVLLCSYTTSVGYGTLLLSANGGIRSFGLAALLGELACITMALIVAPSWLSWLRERRRQISGSL